MQVNTSFAREYELNEELQKKIPRKIYDFFQDFNQEILKQEKFLKGGTSKKVSVEPNRTLLSTFKYADLIKYSRIIEESLGETDLYRTILLAANAPKDLSELSLVKEDKGKAAVLLSKEILDSSIENLVTTDASREFRYLFKYTERKDGKTVRIYKIQNFRWDDELTFIGIPLNSGRESLSKAFNEDPKGNEYLKEIAKAVSEHKGHPEGGQKYLFFYPKGIPIIPPLVELKLIKEGLFDPKETDKVLSFVTFGRETATDEYKDCDVIFFIGLNHKPKHTQKALLAGEGFKGDPDKVLKDVETGEFLQQLIQGTGRGTLRKGKRQYVYYFHHDPERFADAMQEAFPMSLFNGNSYHERYYEYSPDLSDGSTILEFRSS